MAAPLFGEALPLHRPVQRQSRISNMRFTFSQLFTSAGAPTTPPRPPLSPASTHKSFAGVESPTPAPLRIRSPVSPSAYSLPSPMESPVSPHGSILSLYRSPTVPSPIYARYPPDVSHAAAGPEEQQLVDFVHQERQRRHKHKRRRRHHNHHHHGRRSRKQQRHCCFPSVTDPVMRRKFFVSLISGLMLTVLLTIYLSLALSNKISGRAFHAIFIIGILATTVIFCHSLIRLCMLSMRPSRTVHQSCRERRAMESASESQEAVSQEPFVVIDAGDEEEALGVKSEETVKCPPPAYGLWRGSVRVDPANQVYWHRQAHPAYSNHPAYRSDGEGEERPITATQPPEYEEGRAF